MKNLFNLNGTGLRFCINLSFGICMFEQFESNEVSEAIGLLNSLSNERRVNDHSLTPFSSGLRQQLFTEEAPLSALESMLVEQLEACHTMCMSVFRTAWHTRVEDTQISNIKMAESLMRRFAFTLEIYQKSRIRRSEDV